MRKLDFNIADLSEIPKEAKGSFSDAEIAGIQFCNIVGAEMGKAKVRIHQEFRKKKDQIEKEIRENKGIVLLDDSDFNFFRSRFLKTEKPIERNLNVAITEIVKIINKAEKVTNDENSTILKMSKELKNFLKTLKIHNKDLDICLNDTLAVLHIEGLFSKALADQKQEFRDIVEGEKKYYEEKEINILDDILEEIDEL